MNIFGPILNGRFVCMAFYHLGEGICFNGWGNANSSEPKDFSWEKVSGVL